MDMCKHKLLLFTGIHGLFDLPPGNQLYVLLLQEVPAGLARKKVVILLSPDIAPVRVIDIHTLHFFT